jgi:hypothetical protein
MLKKSREDGKRPEKKVGKGIAEKQQLAFGLGI